MLLDITRNQYFFMGVLLLLVGAEFRLVESVELTPEVSRMLVKQHHPPLASVEAVTKGLFQLEKPLVKKVVRPPDWIGWVFLTAGAVLFFHALVMRQSANSPG